MARARLGRGTIVAAVAGIAAITTVVTLAVNSDGYVAQEVPHLETSVWVTREAGQYARVNTDLGEIDLVRDVDDPSAVVQHGAEASVYSQGLRQRWLLDGASPADLIGDEAAGAGLTPTGTRDVASAGDWVAYRTDTGAVYAGTVAGDDATPIDPYAGRDEGSSDDAETETYSATAVGVSPDGLVAMYSAREGGVRRYDAHEGELRGDAEPVADPPAADVGVQLTVVGGRWVLLDAADGRLWLAGRSAAIALDVSADARLQQGAGDAASVLIADGDGLVSVPLEGGEPERIVDAAGVPAQPVTADGEMTAAWISGDGGTLWTSAADEPVQLDAPSDPEAGPQSVTPVLQTNGDRAVLNDTSSGLVWTVPDGRMIPLEQWALDDDVEDRVGTELVEDLARQEPPVAVADAFGVRAGEQVELPVLLNDHDPNAKDVLTVDPASMGQGLADAGFGELSLTLERPGSHRAGTGDVGVDHVHVRGQRRRRGIRPRHRDAHRRAARRELGAGVVRRRCLRAAVADAAAHAGRHRPRAGAVGLGRPRGRPVRAHRGAPCRPGGARDRGADGRWAHRGAAHRSERRSGDHRRAADGRRRARRCHRGDARRARHDRRRPRRRARRRHHGRRRDRDRGGRRPRERRIRVAAAPRRGAHRIRGQRRPRRRAERGCRRGRAHGRRARRVPRHLHRAGSRHPGRAVGDDPHHGRGARRAPRDRSDDRVRAGGRRHHGRRARGGAEHQWAGARGLGGGRLHARARRRRGGAVAGARHRCHPRRAAGAGRARTRDRLRRRRRDRRRRSQRVPRGVVGGTQPDRDARHPHHAGRRARLDPGHRERRQPAGRAVGGAPRGDGVGRRRRTRVRRRRLGALPRPRRPRNVRARLRRGPRAGARPARPLDRHRDRAARRRQPGTRAAPARGTRAQRAERAHPRGIHRHGPRRRPHRARLGHPAGRRRGRRHDLRRGRRDRLHRAGRRHRRRAARVRLHGSRRLGRRGHRPGARRRTRRGGDRRGAGHVQRLRAGAAVEFEPRDGRAGRQRPRPGTGRARARPRRAERTRRQPRVRAALRAARHVDVARAGAHRAARRRRRRHQLVPVHGRIDAHVQHRRGSRRGERHRGRPGRRARGRRHRRDRPHPRRPRRRRHRRGQRPGRVGVGRRAHPRARTVGRRRGEGGLRGRRAPHQRSAARRRRARAVPAHRLRRVGSRGRGVRIPDRARRRRPAGAAPTRARAHRRERGVERGLRHPRTARPARPRRGRDRRRRRLSRAARGGDLPPRAR